MSARTDQEINKASNVYAQEDVRTSWFHLVTTLLGLLSCQIAAAYLPVWWQRLPFSVADWI